MKHSELRKLNGARAARGVRASRGCEACVKNTCPNVKSVNSDRSDRPSVEDALHVGMLVGALVAGVLVAVVASVARAGV